MSFFNKENIINLSLHILLVFIKPVKVDDNGLVWKTAWIPDQLWGPFNFLSTGYWGPSPHR